MCSVRAYYRPVEGRATFSTTPVVPSGPRAELARTQPPRAVLAHFFDEHLQAIRPVAPGEFLGLHGRQVRDGQRARAVNPGEKSPNTQTVRNAGTSVPYKGTEMPDATSLPYAPFSYSRGESLASRAFNSHCEDVRAPRHRLMPIITCIWTH